MPDEPAHYAYAAALAHGEGISQRTRYITVDQNAAIGATELNAIAFHAYYPGSFDPTITASEKQTIDHHRDSEAQNLPEPSSASGYPPFMYLLGAALIKTMGHATIISKDYGLRILGGLIASGAIIFQFLLLGRLLPSRIEQRISTLIIAALPMYTYIEDAINPDVLVTLFISIELWLLVRLIQEPRRLTIPHITLVAAIFGLSLLTKPSAAVVLPSVLVAVLVAAYRTRQRKGITVAQIGVGILVVAAISGWFYLATGTALSPLTVTAPPKPSAGTGLHAFFSYALTPLRLRVFRSFWGDYGWLDTGLSMHVYHIIKLCCTFFAGCFAVHVVSRRRLSSELLVTVLTWVALSAVLLYLEYTNFVNQQPGFMQGRYYFPVIVAIVAICITGLCTVFRQPVIRRTLLLCTLLAVLMFHVTTIAGTIIPRYYL